MGQGGVSVGIRVRGGGGVEVWRARLRISGASGMKVE